MSLCKPTRNNRLTIAYWLHPFILSVKIQRSPKTIRPPLRDHKRMKMEFAKLANLCLLEAQRSSETPSMWKDGECHPCVHNDTTVNLSVSSLIAQRRCWRGLILRLKVVRMKTQCPPNPKSQGCFCIGEEVPLRTRLRSIPALCPSKL